MLGLSARFGGKWISSLLGHAHAQPIAVVPGRAPRDGEGVAVALRHGPCVGWALATPSLQAAPTLGTAAPGERWCTARSLFYPRSGPWWGTGSITRNAAAALKWEYPHNFARRAPNGPIVPGI